MQQPNLPFIHPSFISLQIQLPQAPLPLTPLPSLKPQSPPPINPPTPLLPTPIQPLLQILTLTDIKDLQPRTALNHSFDTDPSDADTAAYREFFEFEEVEADGAEGGV